MTLPTITTCWALRFASSPRADGKVGDDTFEVEVRAEDSLDAIRLALAALPLTEPDLLANVLVEVASAGDIQAGPPVVLAIRRTSR